MPLTKEQLLIPRVMCEGGKEGEPNDTSGDFKTGEILTVGTLVQIGLQLFTASELLLTELCAKFPRLFRPMPWWEGRKPEDMPRYLSSIALYKDFHIVEVSNHYIKHFIGKKDGQYWEAPYDEYLPATEQEYLDYIKQKEA